MSDNQKWKYLKSSGPPGPTKNWASWLHSLCLYVRFDIEFLLGFILHGGCLGDFPSDKCDNFPMRINLTIFQCAAKIQWRLAHFRCNWTDQHLGRNENIITCQGHNTLVLGSKEGRHKNREIFVFDGLFNRWGLCWYFSSWALFWFYFFLPAHSNQMSKPIFSGVNSMWQRRTFSFRAIFGFYFLCWLTQIHF